MKVSVFAGEPGNIKLTTPEDFARAEAIQSDALGDVRTGSGLDVHAFGPGDHVTLGGIRIPHNQALTGHSDADVALHALTDAILGALADGDIGAHFPPSDAAMARRFVRPLSGLCRWTGANPRVAASHISISLSCAKRHVSANIATQCAQTSRACRHWYRTSGCEGDNERETRLHWPRRRHSGLRDGDRSSAMELV